MMEKSLLLTLVLMHGVIQPTGPWAPPRIEQRPTESPDDMLRRGMFYKEDIAFIRNALQSGPTPEAKAAALMDAVSSKAYDIIKLLLEYNPVSFINIQNGAGETALIKAVRMNDVDAVNLLLAQHADTQRKDNYGMMAVDYSTNATGPLLRQAAEGVQRVLEYATLCTAEKCDRLMNAVTNREPEAITVALGNNLSVRDKAEALKQAVKNQYEIGVNALLADKDRAFFIDLSDPRDMMTPLMMAAYRGFGTIVKTLLDAGANPSLKNSEGKTAADLVKEFSPINKDIILNFLKTAEKQQPKGCRVICY